MNENTSDAGRSADVNYDQLRSDRWFVASRGAVQGPFNKASLPEPGPGDWLWRVGQSDWTPANDDNGSRSPAASTRSRDQLDAAWQSLHRRGRAAGVAAKLELRAMQVRRTLAAARQEQADLDLQIGRSAVDQDVVLLAPSMETQRQSALAVIARIAEIDVQIAQEQHQLDRLDPKSPVAARIRDTTQGHRRSRGGLLASLDSIQADLGRSIQADDQAKAIFVDHQSRYEAVQQRIDAGIAEQRAVEEELAAVNGQIGTSFRKLAVIGGGALTLLIVWTAWPLGHGAAPPVVGQGGSQLAQPVSQLPEPGLTRSELRLASALVITEWKALPNTDSGCLGSAAAFATLPDGTLALMTNRHVLGLGELLATQTADGVRVMDYRVRVKFPSGRICPVLKIRPEVTNVDTALLYVDARSLQAGVDYVLLPMMPKDTEPQAGDEVVAIGNPGTEVGVLENTQTYGHVSALRKQVTDGVTTEEIQTDAALNHGNSGGPLMLKAGDRYFWAGINTSGWSPSGGYQGLNFAISSRQAMTLNYYTYDATVEGVASLLTQFYHVTATAYRP